MMIKILFALLIFLSIAARAQQQIRLYENDTIPNSRAAPDKEQDQVGDNGVCYVATRVSRPTLSIFQPPIAKRTGTAVIICPGGAYIRLSMYTEGTEVAEWLASLGITAFVLKYRMPSDETMFDKSIGPLQDAQRAIQILREKAAFYGIDTGRIGILGFSAGGHLASSAGTHFLRTTIDNKEKISLRPDFMVLLYPVISLADSICHRWTRDNLLGLQPDSAEILKYSNEKQVTAQTPPTFIVHAEDDPGVPVVNSIYFYEALIKNHVSAELLVYPKGGHGFGMHNPGTGDQWTDRFKAWLVESGWLKKTDISQ